MSNVLSAISGHFGRALIMGTLLPVVLFAFLTVTFVVPLLSVPSQILSSLETLLGGQWKIITVVLLIIVISSLLHAGNIPIIRFYEGYPWEHSLIGRTLSKRQQNKFETRYSRKLGMRTLLLKIGTDESYVTQYAEEYDHVSNLWIKIDQRLNEDFPTNVTKVLPTRLGNVIRSFEDYPKTQYGIDSVVLWPRLIAKVDKEYAAAIADTKTAFDFMLNVSVLSAVLALTTCLLGFFQTIPLSPNVWLKWAVTIACFVVLAWVFYLLSIGRAKSWGNMVKSAYDLYRGDLLKQLGYRYVPTTQAEERNLWDRISNRIIYGPSPTRGVPEYELMPTSAVCEPVGVRLQITRGVIRHPRGLTIKVRVKNIDEKWKRDVKSITVTDTLLDGLQYLDGSAYITIDDHSTYCTRVVGANPYEFHIIHQVPYDTEVVLTYQAVAQLGLFQATTDR